MAKGQATRRQKDVSRLLREKKQVQQDRIKSVKKKWRRECPAPGSELLSN